MTVRRSARVGVALVLALVLGAAAPATGAEPGTLTVNPSTDLIEDQLVQVTGEDWPSTPFLAIVQCDARAWDFGGCDESAGTFVKAVRGSFTVEFEVEREIQTYRFGTVDCASAPDACMVAALYRPGRVLASAPISFDPEGPPPSPPHEIDVDIARSGRVGPDGNRVALTVRVTCRPGMHADLHLEVAQEHGEDDAVGFGGAWVHRCHGTTTHQIEARAYEGTFEPGHAVVFVRAFGYGNNDEFAHEYELVRATLGR